MHDFNDFNDFLPRILLIIYTPGVDWEDWIEGAGGM